jgi:hypothetical protein
VGGNLTIAAGVALLAGRRPPRVVACIFGDGACGSARCTEAMNVAALWKLPLLLVCDNNGWSVSTPTGERFAPERLSDLAAPFRMPAATVTGWTSSPFATPRSRSPPHALGRRTCVPRMRLRALRHALDRDARDAPAARWRRFLARCPIRRHAARLEAEVRSRGIARGSRADVADTVADAPPPRRVGSVPGRRRASRCRLSRPLRSRSCSSQAIARALREAMSRDPRVIVLGLDVGRYGRVPRVLRPPCRVRRPSRARYAGRRGIDGEASAWAPRCRPAAGRQHHLHGLPSARPRPLVNYGAKLRYKTGGQLRAPVVATTAGARGQGVAHSQCIESWLVGVPGLKAVAPSTAADAWGLMHAALQEDGPVVYVDHKRLFPTAGELARDAVPVPIGRAVVRRRGADVTIATHSYMCRVADSAADRLAALGVACEIVDLRTLAPLDVDTVNRLRAPCARHARGGQLACGIGAEAYRVREKTGTMRVARVGALPAPVSSSRSSRRPVSPAPTGVEAVRGLLQP